MARIYMPIMGDAEITVLPFAMFKPNEARAVKNHAQSLEQLAQRGGLNLSEALDILEDCKCGWSSGLPETEVRQRMREHFDRWHVGRGCPRLPSPTGGVGDVRKGAP